MSHVVRAELWFENRRDAQRCVAELSNTVFDRCSKVLCHIDTMKMKGNSMALNVTQLIADAEKIITDGEQALTIVQDLEALPEVDKVPGLSTVFKYVVEAQAILKEAQKFLNETA